MDNNILSPRRIVEELDKYIIGQHKAKRAVAIALRNRWRRMQIPEDMREEILPKNIIMMGPTGVGKTEIARRLAKLAQSPFLKVEATKYTEVGYVGRDVESMIRDLVDIGINMVKARMYEEVQIRAREQAEEKLLNILIPRHTSSKGQQANGIEDHYQKSREKMRSLLRDGKLDHRSVDVEVQASGMQGIEIFSSSGIEEISMHLSKMLPFMSGNKKKRTMKIPEALEYLTQEEAQKLIDQDKAVAEGIDAVEQKGIIFIDELDKIASRESAGRGPDVSREGVQRDILPIVEGTTVATKHGLVNTNHILFIAAGAFHISKPSDLIPELQGRFPIRVSLDPLHKEDFIRILTEPRNALTKQYEALLQTEGVNIVFKKSAIAKIAEMAEIINEKTENIGARRLYTVMEYLLEDISFDADERGITKLVIDEKYVTERLADIVEDKDLSRYIL